MFSDTGFNVIQLFIVIFFLLINLKWENTLLYLAPVKLKKKINKELLGMIFAQQRIAELHIVFKQKSHLKSHQQRICPSDFCLKTKKTICRNELKCYMGSYSLNLFNEVGFQQQTYALHHYMVSISFSW